MIDNNIPEPVISPEFTMSDIRKIREYNYKVTKNMTQEEMHNYYNDEGLAVHEEIQRRKKLKNL